MVVIDGKKIAATILKQIEKGNLSHQRTLAIVQIGHRPDSDIYIRQKIRAAAIAGITTKLIHCQARASQSSVIKVLSQLSTDKKVDGILLQLPVPSHLETNQLIQAIDPRKDVDGFHPASKKVSPLIQAIEHCIVVSKKKSGLVLILGRTSIFTAALAGRLTQQGFKVRSASSATIPPLSKKADIIISLRGRGPRISSQHLKRGVVVIDAGIRQHKHGVQGDADSSITSIVSAYTPVPGGVGPLTVAYALKNVRIK